MLKPLAHTFFRFNFNEFNHKFSWKMCFFVQFLLQFRAPLHLFCRCIAFEFNSIYIEKCILLLHCMRTHECIEHMFHLIKAMLLPLPLMLMMMMMMLTSTNEHMHSFSEFNSITRFLSRFFGRSLTHELMRLRFFQFYICNSALFGLLQNLLNLILCNKFHFFNKLWA